MIRNHERVLLLISFLVACGESTTPLPQADSGGSGGAPGGAGQPTAGTPTTPSAGMPGGGQMGGAGMSGSGGSGGQTGGAGGMAGSSSGSGGVDRGGSGGAGGAGDGWVKIFNGQDLTGWVPLIHKSGYNENTYNTFRADPVNQVLRVTYEDYPNQNFDGRCGVIYYNKPLKDYRVRVTYRFGEPQANNPVSWGHNNSGLMIFGIDPADVMGDPEFPPLIEIQLLGQGAPPGPTNLNLCEPGGMTMTQANGFCGNNGSGKPSPPPGEWVTVEAEVRVDGDTKAYQHPDLTTPLLTMSGPRYQGQPVTGGYLGLQSESQPIEYKDIELMELP